MFEVIWRMMTRKGLVLFLMLFWLAAACSNEGSGEPAVPTLVERESGSTAPPETETAEIPATPTEVSEVVSADDRPGIDPDLSGTLYYIGFINQRQDLLRLDLETGEEMTLFDPPENAWLSELAVSPDGSQILIAYGPPPGEGEIQFGFTDLFLMPADGSSAPTPLIQRGDPSESYFNISWPVDDMIYFAHFAPFVDDMGAITYSSQIERLHLANGQTEVLAPGAAWPRLSRDGTMLAYVTDENEFLLAGADGSNPRPILDQERFSAVDAPLFSPDNSLICFSAVLPATASLPSIWDRLMGVGVAQAHSVPSDWWCMPVDGSDDPQRLTNLNAIGLYGDFDKGGQHLAFISADGVHVMRTDGSNLTQLRNITTTGTIDWVP
jgi:hypothetical protein